MNESPRQLQELNWSQKFELRLQQLERERPFLHGMLKVTHNLVVALLSFVVWFALLFYLLSYLLKT